MKQRATWRGVGGWGAALGERLGGGKSGACFGLRLQTQIEIPLHVGPVVLIRAMHSLSLPQQQMPLLQLTGVFLALAIILCLFIFCFSLEIAYIDLIPAEITTVVYL